MHLNDTRKQASHWESACTPIQDHYPNARHGWHGSDWARPGATNQEFNPHLPFTWASTWAGSWSEKLEWGTESRHSPMECRILTTKLNICSFTYIFNTLTLLSHSSHLYILKVKFASGLWHRYNLWNSFNSHECWGKVDRCDPYTHIPFTLL